MDAWTPGQSVVFFQGNLYATFWYYNSPSRILSLSYNLEENLWREVYEVEAKNSGNPQLIASGNRLFLTTWVDAPRQAENLDLPERVFNYSNIFSLLEITEILVDEHSSRPASIKSVVQLAKEDVEKICGESQTDFLSGIPLATSDISFGFPLNSYDNDFLVLFLCSTGKVILYDMWSGSVYTLPAHPLRPFHQAVLKREEVRNENEGEEVSSHFSAKLMNLRVRNILSGDSVLSRSHA